MKAMLLNRLVSLVEDPAPLQVADVPEPTPAAGQLVIQVSACGVCHTELDEIEGRTPPPSLPIIPGHQVVGWVVSLGEGVTRFKLGERVGVGWIYSACGECEFCRRGDENLCSHFLATGRDVPGGYAEYMAVSQDFAYPIPPTFSDTEAAPLLCAGAIGYRSLRLTNLQDGGRLGLMGFGASAHLVLQIARHRFPGASIYVFSVSEAERALAEQLGAAWVGEIKETPPQKLDAIIDTTPVWKPVVAALRNLERGGRLVINAIRKEDVDKEALMQLHYPDHLWMEKEIKSVANVSRRDIGEFLELAAAIPIRPQIEEYPLEDANQALWELKQRRIRGAKVLRI